MALIPFFIHILVLVKLLSSDFKSSYITITYMKVHAIKCPLLNTFFYLNHLYPLNSYKFHPQLVSSSVPFWKQRPTHCGDGYADTYPFFPSKNNAGYILHTHLFSLLHHFKMIFLMNPVTLVFCLSLKELTTCLVEHRFDPVKFFFENLASIWWASRTNFVCIYVNI